MLPNQTGFDGSQSSVCSSPVIGILSHPLDGARGPLANDPSASFIAGSYVEFVEAGGARVIPLIYNEPQELLFQKLELVNGVIFANGWAKQGLYYDIVTKIFNKALERNDAGEHFPLYGICHGFELMSIIISQNRDILEKFDVEDDEEDIASSLQFVENVNIRGTLFQRFSSGLLEKLSSECLVMHNYQYGITPANFQGNLALSSFFEILTTCVDENNNTYVSTVKAKRYPITGFQWHPEKNAFEWGSYVIPHSEDAIQVTQHAANYLVSEAMKSLNRPSSERVLSHLISNYEPTHTVSYDVYLFTQPRSRF